jgi:hypothetical protein
MSKICSMQGQMRSPEDGDTVSLKLWYLPMSPHNVTTQIIIIIISVHKILLLLET